MPRPPNVDKVIAQVMRLDEASKALVRKALEEDPRVTKLKAEKERIEAELAALTGTSPRRAHLTPSGKRRGRPAKAVSVTAKAPKAKGRRGRPPKASSASESTVAPKKRGRPAKAVSTPATRAAAAPKPKPARTPEQQAAIDARMAKARAARDANRAKAGTSTPAAPKVKKPKKVKRVIVDNDLIRPAPKK